LQITGLEKGKSSQTVTTSELELTSRIDDRRVSRKEEGWTQYGVIKRERRMMEPAAGEVQPKSLGRSGSGRVGED
jgi:hypothetical protein